MENYIVSAKKINFRAKSLTNINVFQNILNIMQSQIPSFPPRYLFLQPRLFRLLVGSHLLVKQPEL